MLRRRWAASLLSSCLWFLTGSLRTALLDSCPGSGHTCSYLVAYSFAQGLERWRLPKTHCSQIKSEKKFHVEWVSELWSWEWTWCFRKTGLIRTKVHVGKRWEWMSHPSKLDLGGSRRSGSELLGQLVGLSIRAAWGGPLAVFVLVGRRGEMLTGEQETRQEHPQGYYTGKVSLKFVFKRETVSFQDRLNMGTLGGRSFFQNRVIFWGWSSYHFKGDCGCRENRAPRLVLVRLMSDCKGQKNPK